MFWTPLGPKSLWNGSEPAEGRKSELGWQWRWCTRTNYTSYPPLIVEIYMAKMAVRFLDMVSNLYGKDRFSCTLSDRWKIDRVPKLSRSWERRISEENQLFDFMVIRRFIGDFHGGKCYFGCFRNDYELLETVLDYLLQHNINFNQYQAKATLSRHRYGYVLRMLEKGRVEYKNKIKTMRLRIISIKLSFLIDVCFKFRVLITI